MTASVPDRRSRRAVLGAALGATAATVATAVHAPRVLGAGSDGSTVVIGGAYLAAQSQTKILNTSAVSGDNDSNRTMWLESQLGTALYAKGDTGVFAVGNGVSVGAWTPNNTGVGMYAVQGTSAPFIALAPAALYGLTNVTDGAAGVRGYAYGDNSGTSGVWGQSDSTSTAYGVYGLAAASTTSAQGVGVYGHAMSSHGGVGTYGYAEAATGTTYGAIGHAVSPTGVGAYGYAPGGGVGVRATSIGGVALEASGRIVAHKVSGVATIAKGKTSVTVKPGVGIGSSSFVLLSPRGNLGSRGLWSTLTANSTAGTITIRVSSAVSAATQIGWLLLG
jgi:hypothetical protein